MSHANAYKAFWDWDFDARRFTMTETHFNFRRKCRAFVEKEMTPFVDQWEEDKAFPLDLAKKAYDAGIFGAIWPREYGGTPMDDFDAFHDQVFWEEVALCGSIGTVMGAFYVAGIALPPLILEGIADKKKNREVITSIVRGDKFVCLAVTEPSGGSDVSAIKTTAEDRGDYFLVNGSKTFITGGYYADYFTVAVRTGGEGMQGLSFLLMEKNTPGMTLRRLVTNVWKPSSTTAISFEDCQVPKANLIGKLNKGFIYVMKNFNTERWRGAAIAVRSMRQCMEDAIDYAQTRKTFGQPIVEHQAIRHKIGEMIGRVMTSYAFLESVTQQYRAGAPNDVIAGPIAILKTQVALATEYVTRESHQIFGGRAFLQGGRAGRVERACRDNRVFAVGGGTQEIMLELSTRQAKL